VLGTEASDELARIEERLAPFAVEPLVVAFVEVAARGARPPETLHPGTVARIDAGANEVIVGELERFA